jgi:hypothetical protein
LATQNGEPSAFHHPAASVPGGQALEPVSVQQNSVYPSQHCDPQSQLEPAQPQTAA